MGIVIGCLGLYFILRPKLQATNKIEKEIEEQNNQLKLKNKELNEKQDFLNQQLIDLYKQTSSLETKKQELSNNIKELQDQAQQSTELLYQKSYECMQEKLNIAAENLRKDFVRKKDEYEQDYLQLLQESTEVYNQEIENKQIELQKLLKEILEQKTKIKVIVEANKREEQKRNETEFYKLIIPKEDIIEINKLREILPYLRDSEPLNKVIWKVYYENPTTDLIGRVVGSEKKTGIYKITCLLDQKCYVGQAVNIASRWKQHIKRGIGAEAPTRNKLYPAMLAIGVENFSFEIIEECSPDKLNEREQYWQDYFYAKSWGYSIK